MTFGQHCSQLAADRGFCAPDHRAPFAALIDREIKGWASSDDAQNIVDLGRRGKKIPPTYEEVATYVIEIGATFAPEAFIDFYTSKGWIVGKAKMKDWCAAARMWKREEWGKKPEAPKVNGKLTEWERKQKVERMCKLRDELQDILHPGGMPYPVAVQSLKPEKQTRIKEIREQIDQIQKELLAK